MAEAFLHAMRAAEREEARINPNQDRSDEVPLPLSEAECNPNVICIDLKRRCVYPWGTTTKNDPLFWKRTVTSSFRKSYLYLLHLQRIEENGERPLTQALWWATVGPAELADHENAVNGCLPVDPPYPPAGQPWSVACFDIANKSLWHMDSPTNRTMHWTYTTAENQHDIHWYLFMLVEEWEDHHYLRTPLEFRDPNFQIP